MAFRICVHWLLHELSKCHFSQNLSVRPFLSCLDLVLNVVDECFMQKTQGKYFSSLFFNKLQCVVEYEIFLIKVADLFCITNSLACKLL